VFPSVAGIFSPLSHIFNHYEANTMNKFDSSKLRTKSDNLSEGWLVQVYSGDRRLLCVIESSHAWTFLFGCGLGLLLAVGWVNLARDSPSKTYEPATTPPELWVD